MMIIRHAGKLVVALVLIAVAGAGCKGVADQGNGEDEGKGKARVMRAEEEPCTLSEPCEESAAQLEGVLVGDARLESAVFIDAREETDFEAWSYRGARNVVYDFLDPPPPSVVSELTSLNIPHIVVYGDGDNPDTGEALARELASYGVPNVYFLEGGAPALRGGQDGAAEGQVKKGD